MTAVLVLLLARGALICLVLGAVQAAWRSRIGLNDVSIVAADDTRNGSPTLRSDRLGLFGLPDYLGRGAGFLIPLEQKPRARRVHNWHVMQLAAQCFSSAMCTARGPIMACSYSQTVNALE